MENHPVPQQISSYSFKLVGDMTLKQFFEVAGGVLVAILLYALPLHPLIKWPLILIAVASGGALAFIPFEERPLEQWVFAFFRSIYTPTLFYWKKPITQPQYFSLEQAQVAQKPTNVIEEVKVASPSPEVHQDDLKNPFISNLEGTEQAFLSQVNSLFTVVPSAPTPKPQPVQPLPQTPAPIKPQGVVTQPVIAIPQPKPITVPKTATQTIFADGVQASANPNTTEVQKTFAEKAPTQIKQAEFSLDVAPPSPPSVPNTITGQTIDPNGKIVEGAILEIKDTLGRPVRALRTNKAGHFLIVTPLAIGKYELTVEKDGLIFEPVSFEANGTIIPPIALRAKSFDEPLKEIYQSQSI